MRHLETRNETSPLNRYAFLWLRRGSVARAGQVTGYRIPGPTPNQEVLIANFGAPRRSDWRFIGVNGQDSTSWTGHHESAVIALAAYRGSVASSL